MKIHELLQEEKFDDYIRRLISELKIHRLGKGAFGHVFQHPTHPEVVVKVFAKDVQYSKYLKWCQEHQSNRYVPKIIDVVKVKQDDGTINIVFFEKLKRAGSHEVLKVIQYVKSLIPSVKFGARFFTDFNGFKNAEWELLAKQRKDTDLAEFAEYVVEKILSLKKSTLDLHNNNVMMRGDQLVFTDPASDS